MSAKSIVTKALSDIPKCVAAGVVDLETGILLEVNTRDSHPQEVIDILAPATKDLYEGDNVIAIENLFKKARGVKSDEHYFQEMLVMSENLIHFFGRLKSNERVVMTAVSTNDANIGMVLAKGRAIVQNEDI